MAEHVSTNQFKNGMHIDVDGTIYRIVEFQHVKPGKGGAFVRTKLKAFSTGAVVDRTFRAGEKFPRILTSVSDMQFLYDDGTESSVGRRSASCSTSSDASNCRPRASPALRWCFGNAKQTFSTTVRCGNSA